MVDRFILESGEINWFLFFILVSIIERMFFC